MRIPKFRVWDNVDHMSKPFTLSELQAELVQFDCACPIMQFTGLTDKNGVEVYEGDIVKHNDRTIRACVVSFFHGCWMATSKDDEPYFKIYWHLKNFEIIGNVHQNPELLEQNDE